MLPKKPQKIVASLPRSPIKNCLPPGRCFSLVEEQGDRTGYMLLKTLCYFNDAALKERKFYQEGKKQTHTGNKEFTRCWLETKNGFLVWNAVQAKIWQEAYKLNKRSLSNVEGKGKNHPDELPKAGTVDGWMAFWMPHWGHMDVLKFSWKLAGNTS